MSSLEDLEVLAESLLKQAQGLPPGKTRNDALKDIGKLRKIRRSQKQAAAGYEASA